MQEPDISLGKGQAKLHDGLPLTTLEIGGTWLGLMAGKILDTTLKAILCLIVYPWIYELSYEIFEPPVLLSIAFIFFTTSFMFIAAVSFDAPRQFAYAYTGEHFIRHTALLSVVEYIGTDGVLTLLFLDITAHGIVSWLVIQFLNERSTQSVRHDEYVGVMNT